MNKAVAQIAEVKKHVNFDLVERLEFLLSEAKRGELLGIAYVGQYSGDLVCSSWALDNMNPRKLVGELTYLQHELVGQTT